MRKKFQDVLLLSEYSRRRRYTWYAGFRTYTRLTVANCSRETLEIPEVSWVSRVGLSRSRSIINPKTKVNCYIYMNMEWHSDFDLGEKARITAAGGFVDFGRVNGNLALSRAIGDFEFKKSAELAPEQQIVTAFPDVTVHEISDDDEFLVVACDGKKHSHRNE